MNSKITRAGRLLQKINLSDVVHDEIFEGEIQEETVSYYEIPAGTSALIFGCIKPKETTEL